MPAAIAGQRLSMNCLKAPIAHDACLRAAVCSLSVENVSMVVLPDRVLSGGIVAPRCVGHSSVKSCPRTHAAYAHLYDLSAKHMPDTVTKRPTVLRECRSTSDGIRIPRARGCAFHCDCATNDLYF